MELVIENKIVEFANEFVIQLECGLGDYSEPYILAIDDKQVTTLAQVIVEALYVQEVLNVFDNNPKQFDLTGITTQDIFPFGWINGKEYEFPYDDETNQLFRVDDISIIYYDKLGQMYAVKANYAKELQHVKNFKNIMLKYNPDSGLEFTDYIKKNLDTEMQKLIDSNKKPVLI